MLRTQRNRKKSPLFGGFLLYKLAQLPYYRDVKDTLKHFCIVLFYTPGRQNRQNTQSLSKKI